MIPNKKDLIISLNQKAFDEYLTNNYGHVASFIGLLFVITGICSIVSLVLLPWFVTWWWKALLTCLGALVFEFIFSQYTISYIGDKFVEEFERQKNER